MDEIDIQQISDWFLCNNILVNKEQAAIMLGLLNQNGYEVFFSNNKYLELQWNDQNGRHYEKLGADNFIIKACEEIYELEENLKDELDKINISSLDEYCDKLVFLMNTERQSNNLESVYHQTKNYDNMQKLISVINNPQPGRNNHVR